MIKIDNFLRPVPKTDNFLWPAGISGAPQRSLMSVGGIYSGINSQPLWD